MRCVLPGVADGRCSRTNYEFIFYYAFALLFILMTLGERIDPNLYYNSIFNFLFLEKTLYRETLLLEISYVFKEVVSIRILSSTGT